MSIFEELVLTFRGLRNKTPFLLVAFATLAISIGAFTTMFTLVNTFLLSSLPYGNADRLVMIWRTYTDASTNEINDELPLSPGAFTDLRENTRSFEQITAMLPESVNVIGAGEPCRINGMAVTGEFFSLLRSKAALGRTLGSEDEQPEAPPVVAISHGYWQRHFGGDPEVIGRTVKIGRIENEVIGVLAADFHFSESLVAGDPRLSKPVDLWTSLKLGNRTSQRGFRFLVVVGRLKPGATLETAQEEAHAYAEYAADQYTTTDRDYGMRVVSLSDQIFDHLRPVLLTLWAATSFVLLIACANLATILMARGQTGHRDIAVRLALGANRSRITRDSLRESILVSLAGGLLSLPIAYAATRLVTALNPVNVFYSYPPRMDLRVFVFTIGVSLVAALLFGAIPAFRASRINPAPGLGEGSNKFTTSSGSRLTFSVLVIAQIALSTTLLIGTGLSVRSFLGLLRADLGVNLERVVTLELFLPLSKYRNTSRKLVFFRELLERTKDLPGVESVGMNYALPFSGVDPSNQFEIEGRPPLEEGENQSANLGLVNPDYFKTLGIPLRRGRFFRDSDTQDAPLVAIIDERMAEQYFSREEPLGRRLSIASAEKITIVGVVGAVKHDAYQENRRPYVYLPYQQRCYMFTRLAVKTRSEESLNLAAAVRRVVRGLDKELPISNVSTLEDAYRSAIAPQRFSLLLISVFAGVALFLTQVGTYGVINFFAKQRQREAGIRMALGAEPKQVFGLIVKQGLTLSLAGTAIGLGIAIGTGKVMATLVYGIETLDFLVFSVIPAMTLVAAVVTCSLPARSLSRVDPSCSLRSV
ncbi:MAG: ABC transporter permease [Deltaproteobacteria bacterium]|nr:ABC transporter permease [Deltaproteobacteria bacterium]